jgi:hypothetical protein
LKESRKGSLGPEMEYMANKLHAFSDIILHPHSTFISTRLVTKDHMDYIITKAIIGGCYRIMGFDIENLKTLWDY